jgi:hypothetical protein
MIPRWRLWRLGRDAGDRGWERKAEDEESDERIIDGFGRLDRRWLIAHCDSPSRDLGDGNRNHGRRRLCHEAQAAQLCKELPDVRLERLALHALQLRQQRVGQA